MVSQGMKSGWTFFFLLLLFSFNQRNITLIMHLQHSYDVDCLQRKNLIKKNCTFSDTSSNAMKQRENLK